MLKREAEGFDNQALGIRGYCSASGLWVKRQLLRRECPLFRRLKYYLQVMTRNHRTCQHTFQELSGSMRCRSLYFLPPLPPFSSSFSSVSTTSTRVLHYWFWLLWTSGNTLLLLATARIWDTHLFHIPFLKEALIHRVASCHLDRVDLPPGIAAHGPAPQYVFCYC